MWRLDRQKATLIRSIFERGRRGWSLSKIGWELNRKGALKSRRRKLR